jgi:hypothetical protein
LLYGSRRLISRDEPEMKKIVVPIRKMRRMRCRGLRKKNFFLRIAFLFRKIKISCNVPMGHNPEQYILPNRTVKIRMIIKPADVKLSNVTHLMRDGANCR